VPGFCPSMGLVAVQETKSGSCDLSARKKCSEMLTADMGNDCG
jgi:hypothetical protein